MRKTYLKFIVLSMLLLLIQAVVMAEVPPDTSENTPAEDVTKPSLYELPYNTSTKTPQSGFLTAPQAGDALDIALDYIHNNKAAYNLSADDVADLIVTDRYISRHNGVTHIYLRQRMNGLQVYGSTINIAVMPDGRIVNVGDRFIRNLNQNQKVAGPILSAAEAVQKAGAHLGVAVEDVTVLEANKGAAAQETLLSKGNISRDNIPAKLMYYPTRDGQFLLVWNMVINMTDNDDWWDLRVDAANGEVLSKDNLTVYDTWGEVDHNQGQRPVQADTSVNQRSNFVEKYAPQLQGGAGVGAYQVYAPPLEDPRGPRTVEINPANPDASPYGWHDTDGVPGAEYLITRGNNVHAYQDWQNIDVSSGDEPNGGPSLLFAFPIPDPIDGPGSDPHSYVDASVTNLFYWNNYIHDVYYHRGFDEASGNFQMTNYTDDGFGGDWVRAESQDGGGFSNANFGTPIDGFLPRMQMYLGGPTPNGVIRDGALDNGVVTHEYGHGINRRLVGGPSNVCIRSAEDGDEGWSDVHALILTHAYQEGQDGTERVATGTWLTGELPNGNPIRPFPYSTDMALNPTTFADVADAGTFSFPHGVGSIWANMAWEVYWAMVNEYGYDPDIYQGTGGNNMAHQLIVDGLKLTPCSPSFTDERDAVLLADLMNSPITPTPDEGYPQSQNECLIWEAFAKRGLGYSADAGDPFSRFDGVEAFDMPPQCADSGSFEINVDPMSIEICTDPAADAVYNLGITAFLGFDEVVTLSTSGEPAGVSVNFNTNGVAAPFNSELTIGNTAGVSGTYNITVMGDATSASYSTTLELIGSNGVPDMVTLASPADGTVDISPVSMLNLSWEGVTNGISYTVEVADDSNFTNVVYSNNVNTTWDNIPQQTLAENTTYYWRVSANNICGAGNVSDTFSFTTRAKAQILLVDDDASENPSLFFDSNPYFTEALGDLEQSYDYWNTGAGGDVEPDGTTLADYDAVVWSGGHLEGPHPAGEAALATYFDGGGCAYISGQDYLYAHGQPLTQFQQDYLGVTGVIHDVGHTSVTGSGPFDGANYNLSFPPGYSGNWSDNLTITATAQSVFTGSVNSGIGAVLNTSILDGYTALFSAFSFETIDTAPARAQTMRNFLNLCGIDSNLSAISLSKTVALDAADCGQSTSLVVPSGTEVTYCYEVTNLGNLIYTTHDLVDDTLGPLLTDTLYSLVPGASYLYTTTSIITKTTTNTAVWTATLGIGSITDLAQAEASAMVSVIDTPLTFNQCLTFEDIAAGDLPLSMVAELTPGSFAALAEVGSLDPYRGDKALEIHSATAGAYGFTQQAAIMMVDLDGQTDAELNFWAKNQGDENHAQDGVFISSDNGVTYHQIYSFNNFPTSYTQVQLDLTQVAADAGISFNDQFLVKIQSFDNFAIPLDGYTIDDLCVQGYSPKLTNSAKWGPNVTVSGDTFTYTIVLNNDGLSNALGVTMTDDIPAELAILGTPTATSGTVSAVGNQVEWTGNVNMGTMIHVSVPVSVTTANTGTIVNTAVISDPMLLSEVEVEATTMVIEAQPRLMVDKTNARQELGIDETLVTTMTLHNIGFADLEWSVSNDISWATLSPDSGTIPRGGSIDAMLTFDSTGINGIAVGDLNFTTNNTIRPMVDTEVIMLVPQDFSIIFTKTVGLDPNTCAPTSDIVVSGSSATVAYCYQVQNTSNVAYTHHALMDDTFGEVFTALMYSLTPGATLPPTMSVIMTDTITADTTRSATWTAMNGDWVASDSDTTSVTFGTLGVEISAPVNMMSGAAGSTVTYTVWITNTSSVSETFDVTVSGLGSANFPTSVGPIATASSMMLHVPIAIPGNATNGEVYTSTVTAMAQRDASVMASVDLITTAIVETSGSQIYLPVILKSGS